MHRPWLKYLFSVLLIVTLMALIAFNLAVVWVATGPRALPQAKPMIQQAFSEATGYQLELSDPMLYWDGWRNPLDVRMRDIRVLTAEGELFAEFPQVAVGLNLLAAMFGEVMPSSVKIEHPVLSFFQHADGHISFGLERGEQPAAATFDLSAAVDKLMAIRALGLQRVVVYDADVSIMNERDGVFLKAKGGVIDVRRAREGIKANATVDLVQDELTSNLQLDLRVSRKTRGVEGELRMLNVLPKTLSPLVAHNPVVESIDLPLVGYARFAAAADGVVQGVNFYVEGGPGHLRHPAFAGPLRLKQFNAEGELKDNFQVFSLSRSMLDLGDAVFRVEGSAKLDGDQTSVRGMATTENAPSSLVAVLWPQHLAPLSRDWVVGNITEGVVRSAALRVDIQPGDLALPVLPVQAIDAQIEVEGAKVNYLPGHPPLRNVAGHLQITGTSLYLTKATADALEATKLTQSDLTIEDLNLDNPYIAMNTVAHSNAPDMATFLGLPKLEHAKNLGVSAGKVSGSVEGTAKVGFYYFQPEGKDLQVDVEVSSKLSQLAMKGFLGKFDVTDAQGELTVNNAGLMFKGGAVVNQAKVSNAAIGYRFKPEQGVDTTIVAEAELPASSLPSFGVPELGWFSGMMRASVDVKQGPSGEQSKAVVDLTQTAVKMDTLHYQKPAGQPARLDIQAHRGDQLVEISAFDYKTAEAQAKGSAVLRGAEMNVEAVKLERLKAGNSDAKFSYEPMQGGGWRMRAEGAALDISAWMKDDGDTFTFSGIPALDIEGSLGQLILGEGRVLEALKGRVRCDKQMCYDVAVSGKVAGDKAFECSIRREGGSRQLEVKAQDAGAFFYAADIYDTMKGGELRINGTFDDTKPDRPLVGKMVVQEHRIIDAPILAKLLTLASFTGIFDVLQGDGIRFEKLRAPFTLKHDVITLKDAKTHGESIGMTADGTITFPGKFLDLKGTIVPAYMLNSMISNVPVIGDILAGGEGGGVFAARYSISGKAAQAEVSVNPLSILTPGFLRGLFDALEGDSKAADE